MTFGKIRNRLDDKGSKYSSLDRPLDKQLIVALQSPNDVDEFELKNAVFGSVVVELREGDVPRSVPDGCWRPGANPRGTRISAVLFGNTLSASAVGSKLPNMWINPWATNPLRTELLPFCQSCRRRRRQVRAARPVPRMRRAHPEPRARQARLRVRSVNSAMIPASVSGST
jgi:hypothetical protein